MAAMMKRARLIFKVKKFVPFLYEYFTSRQVGKKKWLSLAVIIGYFALPFDLIPDFLSIFGILDDVMILTFILQHVVKQAPQELKDKYDLDY
ncbi:YkvA family protein [Guptibacillus algicola]|uniref:YkvA family protein n=1 Tax=Guptibacillus algicola TaxID=225844 RepID=UPI001CD219B0|nr:DUF1232 domain-containing protein [Alkalihalobacillus algicola]MCA0987578.1 DUF1232 domain-containing protein [Alkalihalobacillus algicola]